MPLKLPRRFQGPKAYRPRREEHSIANHRSPHLGTFTGLLQLDTSGTQAVSATLRLRYNNQPDSNLYIIYDPGTQFASHARANPARMRETRFAVKWTYSFALRVTEQC